MSPVGGVGINYAIQDATVASNMLASPLKAGHVEVSELAKVQSDRELPTRIIQAAQSAVQKRIIANVFSSPNGLRIPTLLRLALRIPFVRDIPARLIAFGVHRAHVA
jgi:2-polyprenyl-6-methoxyphenol hydroxylase-like FAD-dependent oxidoreductase